MVDKVIVTNNSALKAKYKGKFADINNALKRLIKSDEAKGLKTSVVDIADAAKMKTLKGSAVVSAGDPKENKAAIDAVYKALLPDYLVILGSIDVIPHQNIVNPIFKPGDDDDRFAYSDLPYACDKPYSRKAEDFIGPTRVVGRIPDLTGASDPAYIIQLIDTAANAVSRPASDYMEFLGISAKVWAGSTRMSLDNIFGTNEALLLSPSSGPAWTGPQFKARSHFINCHGAPATHQFFGQSGNSFPPSHDAALLSKKIKEGTVVAAECCYGAELYDSFLLGGGQMGICSAYLAEKAYGFFGSSTVAYGPPNDNGSADLICQFFLINVLQGASLGRAVLEARQNFASSSVSLDPVDLKTLAQFSLLGDPSICPVKKPNPPKNISNISMKGKKTIKAFSLPLTGNDETGVERRERRQQLRSKGVWLEASQPVASTKSSVETSTAVIKSMQNIAEKFKIADPNVRSFKVKNNSFQKTDLLSKSLGSTTAFHILQGGKNASDSKTSVKTASSKKGKVEAGVCIVAKEVDGKIISFRELHRK